MVCRCTAVVGAGPAGLLFVVIARILLEKAAGAANRSRFFLFDKRDHYVRTHRLRIDPAPFAAIAKDLADPRFDALVAFLEEHHFSPEVNHLEEHLIGLTRELGVERELLAVGDEPAETSLAALRERLEATGALARGDPWTIVAADSVHSAIRELVRGAIAPTRFTHQHVARLRVIGERLPRELGAVTQYRLSKVLGSLLDYRLNHNGFAEIDLFLREPESAAVKVLGATPAEPVPITLDVAAKLRAPLFTNIVQKLSETFDAPLVVQSTFRLEHTLMPQVTFAVPSIGATVFLVGDAAVSLPFFRGMACLAKSAHALAEAHRRWITGADASPQAARSAYEAAMEKIRTEELSIVRGRARLIAGLREFIRLSALLPFPIQSWWLSDEPTDTRRDKVSPGVLLNLAVAVASLASSGAAVGLAISGSTASAWLLATLGALLHATGGVAYHAALNFEPGPHTYVRSVWRIEIATLALVGLVTAGAASHAAISARVTSAVAWFVLGLAFVAGLVAFEKLGAKWQSEAQL